MEIYDYRNAMREDVKEAVSDFLQYNDVKDFSDIDDLRERMYDEFFTKDSVTGNGSGSYTFSTWQAEENLCHNTELLGEALQEFGCDANYLEKGAEACDVIIRCYMLPEILGEVLGEMEYELFPDVNEE